MLKKLCLTLFASTFLTAGEELEDSYQPLVVSLGSHCAPSAYMRYFEVRQAAFPFDWMFTNNLNGFCQVLLNDFEGFLEEKNLEVHPVLPFVVVNTLYNIEFRHDFPTIGPGSHLYSNCRDFVITRVEFILSEWLITPLNLTNGQKKLYGRRPLISRLY